MRMHATNTRGTEVEAARLAHRHLSAARVEFDQGVSWLEVVDPGSVNRAREAVRVLVDFRDRAADLARNLAADASEAVDR